MLAKNKKNRLKQYFGQPISYSFFTPIFKKCRKRFDYSTPKNLFSSNYFSSNLFFYKIFQISKFRSKIEILVNNFLQRLPNFMAPFSLHFKPIIFYGQYMLLKHKNREKIDQTNILLYQCLYTKKVFFAPFFKKWRKTFDFSKKIFLKIDFFQKIFQSNFLKMLKNRQKSDIR